MGDLWDVVVVGAGPAGSAAALAALHRRPQARVLLVDRAAFPRDKACGDGLAPHALDVLESVGVNELVDDYPPVSTLSLGYPAGPRVVGEMVRPARVVPRTVLDDRLRARALDRGAVALQQRVRRVELRGSAVVLDGSIAARTVVAADGARSVLRRACGLAGQPEGHLAVALRGYAPVQPQDACRQRIMLGRGDWPAYAWSFPVGDGSANVGYGEVLRAGAELTRSRLLERLEDLLPGAAAAGERWRAHHLPLSSSRPRQPDGRVLLAGDAAALINPLTGEGIYYGVLSGACAGAVAVDAAHTGDAAAGADAGARYRRLLDRQLGRHLRHTRVAAWAARSPRVVDSVLRAAARDRQVFDTMVEVGLGRGRLTARVLARGLAGAVGDSQSPLTRGG